jgi:WD40 repeat protein
VVDAHEFRDCAVSPDGRYVIAQNNRGTVVVRTLPALTFVGTIEGPSIEPASEHDPLHAPANVRGSGRRWRRFAVSADSGLLAVAGFDRVGIYRLAPFGMMASVDGLPDLPYGILALGFIGADHLAIIGRDEPMPVSVWDLKLRRVVERRELSVPPINGIARAIIAGASGLVVAGGYEATVVWRLEDRSPAAMTSCAMSGQALAVSADATTAATSGPPPTANETERVDGVRVEQIRLWSLPDLRELASWRVAALGCRDIVTALAFSPDGRHLVLGGWDGVLRRLVLSG